jgi:hypothetical protein
VLIWSHGKFKSLAYCCGVSAKGSNQRSFLRKTNNGYTRPRAETAEERQGRVALLHLRGYGIDQFGQTHPGGAVGRKLRGEG